MGAVYEGVQEALGRVVAIKVLHASRGNLRQDQFARFQREARAAAALGHANIVQITDFQWVAGEPPFLVMEKLVGQSLGAAITRAGKLPAQRVAFIAAQALSALHAAHQAGIVHRDIKPDNVFLTVMAMVNDIVKVLDFGVAKLLDEAPITMAGAMVGSPAYMPPEQAYGRPVDGRADIYALGATMYHALSGCLPVDAKDAAEFLAKVEIPAVPLVQLVPGFDPALSQVVACAMAKRPEERFPTAEAMRNALLPWAKPASTAATDMAAQIPVRASMAPGFSHGSVAPPAFAQGSQAAPTFAQGSQAAPTFAQGSQAAPTFAQGSVAPPPFAQGSLGAFAPSAAAYTGPQPAYAEGAPGSSPGAGAAFGQLSHGGHGPPPHQGFLQGSQGGGAGFAAPAARPGAEGAPGPPAPHAASAPSQTRAAVFVAIGVGGTLALLAAVAVVFLALKKPVAPIPPAATTTTTVASAPLPPPATPPTIPSVQYDPVPPPTPQPTTPQPLSRDAGAKPQPVADAGATEAPRRSVVAKAVVCSGPPRMLGTESGVSTLNRMVRDRCLGPAAACPLASPNDRTITRTFLAQLDPRTRSVNAIAPTSRIPCFGFDQCVNDCRAMVIFHQVTEGAVPLTCTIQP